MRNQLRVSLVALRAVSTALRRRVGHADAFRSRSAGRSAARPLRRGAAPAALLCTLIAVASCGGDPEAMAAAFVASGDAYVEQGRLAEAIIEYRNAIEHRPNVASTHYALGLAYEGVDEIDRALDAFVRAAELDSSHVQAHVRAGRILLARGRHADARQIAERVSWREPRDAEALAVLAAAHAGLGDLTAARARLDEALEIQPQSSLAHRLFGTALLHRGLLAEAEEALRTAVEYDERSADAWIALAAARWRRGDPADAERSLERALAIEPESLDAHRMLASVHLRMGQVDRAEPHLAALARADEGSRLALVDFYIALGRDDQALEALAAIEDQALQGAVHLRRAVLHDRRGETADARRELEAAIADADAEADARLVLSQWLLRGSDTEGALAEAKRVADLRPGRPDASYAAGMIHLARGELAEAEQWLQQARREGADDRTIDLTLARVALASRDFGRAERLAREVTAAAPSLGSHLLLARALRGQGDLAGARSTLAAAQKTWPSAAVLDVEEGHLELAAGRADRARAAYTRALEREPALTEARAGAVASDIADGRMGPARQAVNDWRAADPDDVQAMLLAAKLDVLDGRAAEAERVLLDARSRAPGDSDVAEALASLRLSQRDLPAAATYLEEVADARPRPVGELVLLGMLRQESGDNARAQEAYERALRLDPDAAAVAANNLAWIYAEQGRLGEALDLAERAHRSMGDVPPALHTLGWMYHLNGDSDRAIEYLAEARDRAPENERYRRDLAAAGGR